MPKRLSRHKESSASVGVLLSRLYRKRREVMRPVLEHPRKYVLLSIRELADELGVDPATVSRTVLAMGFPSYREFQKYLHQRSVTHSTSFERLNVTENSQSTFEGRVRKTMDGAVRNLEEVYRSLDIHHLAALADRFYAAKRIYILGGDLAVSLVSFLHYQLIVLGLNAIAVTTTGHTTYLMQRVTKTDLVVAISFRRGLRQTVEGLQQARSRGCYTIGIADTLISPIARSADESLLVPIDVPNFSASYVAAMATLDAILSAIANRKRARSMAVLKQMEEDQKSGNRWYIEP
jgi:DNA-binding MurR/RpiR family transcriptional regulator